MGMEPFQSGCVSDDSQRVCLCRVASSTNKVSREMGRCIDSTVPLGSWLFFHPKGVPLGSVGEDVLFLGMFLSRLTAFYYWDLESHLHVDGTF